MLLWGAAPVVLKSLVGQVSGFWLMTMVYAISACVALPWLAAALRQGATPWSVWWKVAVVGVMLTSCFNLLAAVAAPAVKGTTLGAVIALEPLMVAALAAMIGRRLLSWQSACALLVSLVGAWLLIATPAHEAQAGQNAPWAVGLVVLGALLWSAAVVFAGRLQPGWPPLQVSMVMICCGSLPFLVLAPFVYLVAEAALPASLATWSGIAFMAIGATVVANLLWLRSIRQLGPLANSLLINLGPLVTFALSATFLGEAWGYRHTGGAALILAGLVWGACHQHAATVAKPGHLRAAPNYAKVLRLTKKG